MDFLGLCGFLVGFRIFEEGGWFKYLAPHKQGAQKKHKTQNPTSTRKSDLQLGETPTLEIYPRGGSAGLKGEGIIDRHSPFIKARELESPE